MKLIKIFKILNLKIKKNQRFKQINKLLHKTINKLKFKF